jgi:catechol 2,3-dioxygenase-like lactoylglutathione lyase family enzyme
MIASLAHVCIKTTDLEKATQFYCGALGMEKAFHFTRGGKVIGFYIKASQKTFIEVFHADEVAQGTGNQNLHHFCLETDNIERVRHSLIGYAPTEIKMGCDNSLQFWVKDPSGVDVEFHQYTEQSSQFNGADVEVNW